MDDCTKEPPAFGWRTRYVARTNFAGAKQDDGIGPFREMDVTLQNSRQPKAENAAGFTGGKNFGSGRVFLYWTGTLYG